MTHPVSAAVFIKDCFKGAFCVFESLASVLPFCSEAIIADLGSTDGTLEKLKEIENSNPKVKIVQSAFEKIDANVFATLANDLVNRCTYDNVWYFQADEIPHQNLLSLVDRHFEQEVFDLSFWRIQYRENFQKVKWFPHLVHRVGGKNSFNFVNDGMSTDRTNDAILCSNFDGGYFLKWGDMGQEGIKPYVHEMVLDVSLVGGFRDNIPERRRLHAPFWREDPHIEGTQIPEWIEREKNNQNWTKKTSPYNLPKIMHGLVGETKYYLRDELFEALKNDTTIELLGLNDDWRV